MVEFVSVENIARLIRAKGIERVLKDLTVTIEEDFRRWPSFEKTPRIASHSDQGVIELMPTSDQQTYSFKYVNGHPANMAAGLQTVTAFGVLADVATGYPLLLSEMTVLTALRTAATSALAAMHLARKDATVMAIIGNGAQSEFQALAFRALLGINRLRLYDIDPKATRKCVAHLAARGFEITVCSSAAEAVRGADIVTTVTADKRCATILTDQMIGPGVHVNAVGGDCPGKTELDAAILHRAEIFVELPEQTRIEGEIQQLAPDHPVVDLWEVIADHRPGRTSDQAITLFDSVGFAIEDFSALRYLRQAVAGTPWVEHIDLVAEPQDPRNLFGLITDDNAASQTVTMRAV